VLSALVLAATVMTAAGCSSGSKPNSGAPTTTAPSRPSTTAPPRSSTSGIVKHPKGTTPGPVTCANRTATGALLAALGTADGRATAAELPGHTFYGTCGDKRYTVAAIVAGPLATQSEAAAFGFDPVTTAEFFTSTGGSAWAVSGRSSGSFGCSTFDIPAALRARWGHCDVPLHPEPPGPTATGNQTACRDYSGMRTYVRLTGVAVAADGGATLTAIPQGVHCGGPDDLQYADTGAAETLHLLPRSPVGIFDIAAKGEQSEPIGQLSSYLQHPELGIFEVYGDPPDLVTGIAEQYHP